MTITSLLIANRGEIACRIIRTARRLGIHTVAVYSEADADAPHTNLADEAVAIGPAPAAESYLSADRILEAAEKTGAEAIHPGYGFLSENAAFAEAVEAANLIFIGPSPHAIDVMGDKARAKRAMIEAGVPCVPGYQGEDQAEARLIAEAAQIGFPIMVKAAAGGGGRGMRLVEDAAALPSALKLAREEAEAAFGAGDLILEKAVTRARHIEIQVFADAQGNMIHLGERDCSVQRRHQKVIEEAPSPAVSPELRAEMGAAAVAAAKAVAYRGAGTVEFLLGASGAFYFLEMNTRLQVEHPVTEMITGLDLVEWQIRVAEGAPLPLTQDQVRLDGWAIEARLYAEDVPAGFLPSAGPVALWRPAPGLRADAGVETGGEVSTHYDPMAAKLIAHGPTRDAARRRLIRGLAETALIGPATNRDFLIETLAHPIFAEGEATTNFIAEAFGDQITPRAATGAERAFAAALLHTLAARDAAALRGGGGALQGWTNDAALTSLMTLDIGGEAAPVRIEAAGGRLSVTLDGDTHVVEAIALGEEDAAATVDGEALSALYAGTAEGATLVLPDLTFAAKRQGAAAALADPAASGRVEAPMHGLLLELRVAEGQKVAEGETVAVLEAMKMRHEIRAPRAGVAGDLTTATGAQIAMGDLILTVAEEG